MNRYNFEILFQKLVEKKCSEQERVELMRLIGEAENDEVLRSLIYDLISRSDDTVLMQDERSEIILQSILHRHKNEKKPAAFLKRVHMFKWAAVAATILLVAGVGFYLVNKPSDTTFFQYKQTAAVEKKVIELPDGTKVWMSPSSTIKFPEKFKGAKREITLTGEAFFEVVPDASHPFIIHSGGVTTSVIGTSFNVKSYPGQSDIQVVVVSGKVAVSDSADSSSYIKLKASQMALFDKKTHTWSKIETNKAAEIEERKSGRFLYKSELLTTVTADMEQYFGIRIKVEDALKSCKVFADFRLSDRKEEVLQLIALMVNARLSSKDGVFLLTGEGCQ